MGWAWAMPINRLLNDSAVEPEQVELLNRAYSLALRSLHLVDRNDPITEIVARKIIEVGQAGIKDPAEVAARAVKEIGL